MAVVVEDTKRRMTPDELGHIWDHLYRGDKSRSQRGLGLGLSLVKAVVQAHHGTVTVSNTPGRGSQFTVRCPKLPSSPREHTGYSGPNMYGSRS